MTFTVPVYHIVGAFSVLNKELKNKILTLNRWYIYNIYNGNNINKIDIKAK